MKIINAILIVMLFSLFSAPVFADGTHGVKVTVINKTGGKIEILTYNSKDGSMTVPHKVYYVSPGGTRKVKAHGQGTGKLKLQVERDKFLGGICSTENNKLLSRDEGRWKNGTTIIVSSC